MNKICAIIPAYNEEKNLPFLLKKIKERNIDIVVVDDGSTDRTASISEREATHLIKHQTNEGKGKALRDGFRFAIERGYDIMIFLDADGQHDPDEIPIFIDEFEDKGADIVVGNRLHSPAAMPPQRLFINKLFSKIVSKICKQDIPDALCGYRIIKRRVLESITLTANRFDIDPEILIKAAKANFKIGALNIKCIYAGGLSKIRPLRDGKDFFLLIIRELASR